MTSPDRCRCAADADLAAASLALARRRACGVIAASTCLPAALTRRSRVRCRWLALYASAASSICDGVGDVLSAAV